MDRLHGRTVGPYQILELLGRGGMGRVYRAVHLLLQQPRALKILRSDFVDEPDFVARFRREATIAAGLRHPNIVQIYDVGEVDEIHYLAMELLIGSPLDYVSHETGPLELDRATHLLHQLANALDYAHSQGVLHRDIKPANIFISPQDHLTLVDFGIARAIEGTRLTATGMFIGTPHYLAPEAWRGHGATTDADRYALGVG